MKLGKKKIQELKENKIQIEDLNDQYFISESCVLWLEHRENILKLLKSAACSLEDIINKYKSMRYLYKLLENERLFKHLIENDVLTQEDLKHLFDRIENAHELNNLNSNTFLLKYMIDNNILSFQELIDKCKSMEYLDDLLKNKELIEDLIESNMLTLADLRYLFEKIDKEYEVHRLCNNNTSLIKKILNEFVLNKEVVDRLNSIIENNTWCKRDNMLTIFKLIEWYATHDYDRLGWPERDEDKIDQELLELNELNNYAYSFNLSLDQKLELIEILKNNEIALNRLREIVDSNLENTFDFESLKVYLNKKEKRNLINI